MCYQCPYCKINFERNPWAVGSGSVVCWNCRNYSEQTRAGSPGDGRQAERPTTTR
jgi:hypothetical protein